MTSQLPVVDIDALLWHWPSAACCPAWRLGGGSPSPGRFQGVRSNADHDELLRDRAGQAVGLLEVREVDRSSRSGYLGFMLPRALEGVSASIVPFLRRAVPELGLSKIVVLADEDMLDALVDARPHLTQVGCLRAHTRVSGGRFVDRHVFELKDEEGPT